MEQMDTLFLLKEKFEEDMTKHGSDPTKKGERAIIGEYILPTTESKL